MVFRSHNARAVYKKMPAFQEVSAVLHKFYNSYFDGPFMLILPLKESPAA